MTRKVRHAGEGVVAANPQPDVVGEPGKQGQDRKRREHGEADEGDASGDAEDVAGAASRG